MNVENCLITNEEHRELCKIILKLLNCNVLWVMNVEDRLLRLVATDSSILQYYWDKKYYLQDLHVLKPKHPIQVSSKPLSWKVHLGSDCATFKKSGFLYDLYKLFDIEELASIEKNIGLESYCFRFFTRNNRFVFMNKLLNNMPFIKFFMNAMIKNLEVDLRAQPGVAIVELR